MNALSGQIIELSKDYLGPAAERFISRQVTQHLKKDMDSLLSNDLEELAKWVNVSAGLLIDKTKARELADTIKHLSK